MFFLDLCYAVLVYLVQPAERVCLFFPQHWKGAWVRNTTTQANERIATILEGPGDRQA
ncbi:hypothetical protein PISMIDRAFT_672820, partial [Pisolithus microcarpus 441]